MDAPPVLAIDTARLPWEERFNEKLGRALFRKNLITDPDTGMEVRLIRYPAGVINVRHASRSAGQERGLFPFSLSVDLSLHDADENVCPPQQSMAGVSTAELRDWHLLGYLPAAQRMPSMICWRPNAVSSDRRSCPSSV